MELPVVNNDTESCNSTSPGNTPRSNDFSDTKQEDIIENIDNSSNSKDEIVCCSDSESSSSSSKKHSNSTKKILQGESLRSLQRSSTPELFTKSRSTSIRVPSNSKLQVELNHLLPKPLFRSSSTENSQFTQIRELRKPLNRRASDNIHDNNDFSLMGFDEEDFKENQDLIERNLKWALMSTAVLRGLKYVVSETDCERSSVEVISGSMRNLTKYVISRASIEPACTEAFVLTYRQFGLTPLIMLKNIERIFERAVPENFCSVMVSEMANLLISWIWVAYSTDFHPRKKSLFSRLLRFLTKIHSKGYAFDANRVKLGILKASAKYKSLNRRDELVEEIEDKYAKPKCFHDFSTRSIAEYFTQKDSKLFQSIQPPELLNLAWKSDCKEKIAPHVVALVELANTLSYWVAIEICLCKDVRKRVDTLKRFIAIAFKCFLLNNFNTMMNILGALNNVAVQRLKKTWAILPEKYQSMWDTLSEVMDTKNNYSEYRNRLNQIRTTNDPAIPFLGVFLRDITFIEDGNPNMASEKHVNFEKIKLLGAVIRDVQSFQKVPYLIKKQQHIVNFFATALVIPEDPDDTVYELSLIVEPIGC